MKQRLFAHLSSISPESFIWLTFALMIELDADDSVGFIDLAKFD